jgi:hypothetical protein
MKNKTLEIIAEPGNSKSEYPLRRETAGACIDILSPVEKLKGSECITTFDFAGFETYPNLGIPRRIYLDNDVFTLRFFE